MKRSLGQTIFFLQYYCHFYRYILQLRGTFFLVPTLTHTNIRPARNRLWEFLNHVNFKEIIEKIYLKKQVMGGGIFET
jgi:hypothetical protein